ncbi:MAG: efflux RND transporter permease subunit, partial [Pseudomonadota bacterium]
LETKLQETPYLDHLISYSKPGESTIFVNLKNGTPAEAVPESWYQVRKKLWDIRAKLPEGVGGPFSNDEFGNTFGIIYAFTSDGIGHARLRDYVDDVRQQLLQLEDVDEVELLGVQEEKIFLEFSSVKLASQGLSPALIIETLQGRNYVTPSGVAETDKDEVHLRVSGLESVEAIRELGIRASGRIFRLGDIAHIYRDYVDPPEFKVRFMGEDAIALAVSMREGGKVLALGRSLDAAMAQIEENLPIGVGVHRVANQPEIVRRSIGEFLKVLAEALAIVLLVSFVSLGLRTGIIVAFSIPLVLAATFLGMKLSGVDLQRISLGALIIALGLLVDDAMIAIEMMAVKLEQGWERFRAATFAYTNTAFPMLTGTAITVTAFSPVSFAESVAGEYTRSIFIVVGLALTISWLVAVLFIPFLGFRLLPKPNNKDAIQNDHERHQDVYSRPIYVRFRRLVDWCVRRRWRVISLTVIVFFGALGSFRFVDQSFFPAANRHELMVDLWLPQGASFAATMSEAKKMEAVLVDDPDVDYFAAYIGGGSPRFYLPLAQELTHTNLAQFMVMTNGPDARDRVQARVGKAFEKDFLGIRGRVQPLFNGPPISYPIEFRVVGKDYDEVRRIASLVAEAVRADPATRQVHLDWNEKTKMVQLSIDQDKARILGISTRELALSLNAILDGHSITSLREGNRSIEVLARASEEERIALENIGDISIPTTDGRFVPLGQLATLSYGLEEGIVWRRDRFPTITVRADVVTDVQAPEVSLRIDPKLNRLRAELPQGYRIEIGGTAEISADDQAPIIAVVPTMILAVLTLLMLQLQNFQRALLVLLTAPLGLIGVVGALLAFDAPFGFVAMLGVIALSGMIVRNAVILVDQIEQDRNNGSDLHTAIVEATVRRLRPIALTAAAAVLAMIPLTQSIFWGPMAMAIMGGLLVATVLTLLFLPALYAAWFRADSSVPIADAPPENEQSSRT